MKAASGRVVVVGSINRDLVLRCADLPAPGETVLAASAQEGFGGKGGNQAVAAARAGAQVVLVAAIGADGPGRAAVKDLRDHGVDVSSVATLDGSRTGAAYVFVDARSENFVVLDPGANRDLPARAVTARLDAAGLTPRDVLLTSGEVSTEVVDAAADVARRHGATHVHNLAPVHALGPWSRSDRVLLVVNELEAAQATSGLGPSAAALELSAGRRGALVTLGSRGAAVADGRGVLLVPSPAVRAVDSTGAGDAFCGALAAALSAGCSLPTAAEIAVRAGAQAVTAFGARGDLDQPPDDADPTGPGAVRPTHQPPSQGSAQ